MPKQPAKAKPAKKAAKKTAAKNTTEALSPIASLETSVSDLKKYEEAVVEALVHGALRGRGRRARGP